MKLLVLAWIQAASLAVTPPDLGSDRSWANFLTAYPEALDQISRHERWVKALPPDKASWVELMDVQFDADPVWAKEALSFVDAQAASAESMAALRSLDQFLGDNRLFEAAELIHGRLLLNDNYARGYRDLVSAMAEAPGWEYHIQCWNNFNARRDDAEILFNTTGKGGIEAYRRQFPEFAPLWQPCLDFLDRNPALYDAARRYYVVLKNEPAVASQIDRMNTRFREETNEANLVELWRIRTQLGKNRDFWVRYLNHERARASRGDNGAPLLRVRRELSADPDTSAKAIQYRRWVLSVENLGRRMHERRQKLREQRQPVVLGQIPELPPEQ